MGLLYRSYINDIRVACWFYALGHQITDAVYLGALWVKPPTHYWRLMLRAHSSIN